MDTDQLHRPVIRDVRQRTDKRAKQMTTRHWWNNVGQEADSEISAIDSLESEIAPVAENVSKIRELIGSL